MNCKCHGIQENLKWGRKRQWSTSPLHESTSKSLHETTLLPKRISGSWKWCHKDFPKLSGTTSYGETQLTLMLSSAPYTTLHLLKRTLDAESTQISLGKSDPARKITTSGEWSSAWNATAWAITFAFPHRKEELQEYSKYMDSEFSARISSSHRKLFAFDKAVWHHVGWGGTNYTPHWPQCLLLFTLGLPFARRSWREHLSQHN